MTRLNKRPYNAVLVVVVTAISYGAVAWLSLRLLSISTQAALFWPASGLSLALYLRLRRSAWPWISLGVLLGCLAVYQWMGYYELNQTAWFILANVSEPFLAAVLLRRVVPQRWELRSQREIGALVLLGLVACSVAAVIGVTGLPDASVDRYSAWLYWAIEDYVGILVVCPLLLVWSDAKRWRRSWRQWLELGAMLGAVAAVTLLIFSQTADNYLVLLEAHWIVPLLIWAAVKRRLFGAINAIFMFSVVSVLMTMLGQGPFVTPEIPLAMGMYGLQVFLAFNAVMILMLGGAMQQRDQVRQDLQNSEQRFRDLFTNMIEGVALHQLVTDRQGQVVNYRVLEVNPAFSRLTGLDAAATRNKLATDAYHCSEPPYLQEYKQVVESGQALYFETFFGQLQRHYRVCAFKLEQGFVTVFEDISARKQLEQQLETYRHELEDKVAQRTRQLTHSNELLRRSNLDLEQFAYVASHDLQEPLRMISSFVGLLQRRYQDKLDEDGRQFMEYVADGARRMSALISDLLTYSRVGRREEPLQDVDLQDIITDVKTDLHSLIAETHAVIEATNLPTLLGQPTEMRQLFQNLIANALKYRSPHRAPHIRIQAQAQQDWWKISIADNGIGIAAEHHERIFDLFTRLQPRAPSGGTGIGLALCKRIVSRHGGRIWVESTPGQGATFLFTWPCRSHLEVLA